MSHSFKTSFLNRIRAFFLWPPAERALLRAVRGRPLDSLWAKIIPNHYQYPRRSRRKVFRFGLHFDLDISELVDWAIYYELREREQETYFAMVSKGSTVIDVGANIGSTAMRFALAAGDGGRVIGFEPDSKNYSRCAENLAMNELPNVVIEPLGLGAKRERANLYRIDERNPGMNRILPKPLEGVERSEVSVTTLDEYLAERRIEKIGAIKVDVEGFELKVLRGAERTIRRSRPLLFLEVSDENLRQNDASAEELVRYLSEMGARIRWAKTGRTVAPDSVWIGVKSEIICDFPPNCV